jgi:hypothetical protein
MQLLDVRNPALRATMRELRQICERRRPEINQMLTLQIATGALASNGRDACSAVLGQNRPFTGVEFALMLRPEAPRDDAHALAIQIQRPGQANRVRRHRVRMAVVPDDTGRADADG